MSRVLWMAIGLLACLWLAHGQVSIKYTDCPKSCKCEKKTMGSIMSCKTLSDDINAGEIPITHFEINQSEQPISVSESIFTIMGLKHVNIISISNSSIQFVDKLAFQGLDDLTHIKLVHSNVSTIHPDTFKQIPNLKKLNLKGNPLNSSSVLTSESVEELDISYCNLSEITPTLFEQLPKLIFMDLSGNKIDNLNPGLFDPLIDIEEINLSHNKLKSLPKSIFPHVPDILNLSYNPLTSFSGEGLSNLESLYLRSCLLKQIDAYMFKNMSYLSNLDLSYNKITNIDPRAFNDLKRLAAINLSNNDIRLFNENLFVNNPFLLRITLDNNNHLAKLPANGFAAPGGHFFNVDKFSCSNCNIRVLPEKMFKTMPTLVILNLSNNKISDISTDVFQPLISLVELDLSNNQISTVNDNTFKYNRNLNKLVLSHNPLKALHASMFKENENLKFLDLSFCGLFKLWTAPPGSLKLNSMVSLNISDNKIKNINKDDLAVTNHLKSLDISNNPLECFEDLKELIEYLHTHEIRNAQYVTHEKLTYDFDERENTVRNDWRNFVRSICPDPYLLEGEDDENNNEEYNDDEQYTDGDLIILEPTNREFELEEVPVLHSKHPSQYRYSFVWLVLVFIGTALAVLGVTANIILFVIRRRQSLPVPRIINVGSKSLLKKNSGLVYQQLSEEHGPKTPILSRFAPLPTVQPNEPENV